MADTTVKVKFLGDAKDLERSLSGVDKALKDVDDSSKKTGINFAGLAKSAAIGFGAVAVGAAVMAKGAIDAASDFNEALSKVTVVFGKSSDEIVAWSKTSAKAMGISQREALEAAGTFGNLFSAMKITSTESVKMSKGIVGLASDLASFNNAKPEDVLIALKAGLVGETEPLRAFGVNLSAARVEAEALSSGLVKGEVDLLKLKEAQMKVNETSAAYVIQVQKHGVASAEAEKANLAREKAEQKLNDVMGGAKPVLDAATKATATYKLIMDDTALAQGDFGRTADGAANQQRILAAEVENLQAKIGQKLLPLYVDALRFAVEKLLPWVSDTARDLGEWWRKQEDLHKAIKDGEEDFKNFIEDVKVFAGWVKEAYEWTKKLTDAITGLPGGNISGRDIWKKIPGADKSLIDIFGGKASGGPVTGHTPYVVGERGPEVFVPASSGSIIPNRRMGGGGVTVVVQGSVLSERDLVGVLNNAMRRGFVPGV